MSGRSVHSAERRPDDQRRPLRPHAGLQGQHESAQRHRGDPRSSARPRPSTLSFDLVGLRATRVTVAGVAHAGLPAERPQAPGHAAARRSPPGDGFTITVAYAGAPRPRRSRWGTIGWEELEDGALVASQPTGAPTWFPCNDVPSDKATYRLSFTTDSAYTVVASGRRDGAHHARRQDRRGPSSRTCRRRRTSMTVHVGRYVEETAQRSGGSAGRLFYPAAARRPGARRLRRSAPHDRRLRAPFGPYPLERVHRRRHRRRPRDPARGAGHRRLRRESHRRHPAGSSGSSRTSSPTSGSATASASRSGRTSGSTRVSRATRSGCGRSTPAARPRTRRRSPTTRDSRRCRRIS